MYILTIIPIARGIPFDTLSYYAPHTTSVGAVVSIPFGKQTINGIVIACIPLSEAKTFVKQAHFALKKIKQCIGHIPMLSETVAALQETAQRTLVPVGAIAAAVIPQTLFEYTPPSTLLSPTIDSIEKKEDSFEEHVVCGTREERLDYYKRSIRSFFARKKSVVIVAPTIRALQMWHADLQKGIDKHTVVLHSACTKKTLRTHYTTIAKSDVPLLIFTTPGYSVIPRSDIGLLIIEDETSSLYKTSDRFAIDCRIFLRHYALHTDTTLYWGDTIPRFETLSRLSATQLPRTLIPDKCTIVPIAPYRTELPTEVLQTLVHAYKHRKRVYIHCARKGIAPLSRCNDCGTVVSCPNCTLPMILRSVPSNPSQRTFLCIQCTTTLPPSYTCIQCTSWNITPVPIGTESVRDAVRSLLGPEATIVTIDDDLTPDTASVQKIITEVEKNDQAVIIGTIKVIPYLPPVSYTIFPFIDRLLSVPSLYTTEHVLRLLMQANERSTEKVLVFTKQAEFPFLSQIGTYKINTIIQEELTLRSEIGYPPFGSLIKIIITTTQSHREEITERMDEYFSKQDISLVRTRPVPQSNKIQLQYILKEHTSFIEEQGSELSLFLSSLRAPFSIEENPERL